MSEEVRFEEEGDILLPAQHEEKGTRAGMARWLINKSIVSNVRQANLLLYAMAALLFVAAALVFLRHVGWSSGEQVIYREDYSPEVLETIPPDVLKTLPSREGL